MTKFNPETCHQIILGLEEGNYQKTAAALAGVDESTFYKWMKRGQQARSGKYFQFFQSVKKAEEKAKAPVTVSESSEYPEWVIQAAKEVCEEDFVSENADAREKT